MKVDLRKLYGLGKLEVDEFVSIDSNFYTNMNVKSMDKVKVEGLISINYEDNIELNLDVTGNFIMPCEITGEDVIIPFNTHIEEEIVENTLNDNFYLDLSNILWENIVLEIPFKVVKEGAKIEKLQGEGWSLSTEEA